MVRLLLMPNEDLLWRVTLLRETSAPKGLPIPVQKHAAFFLKFSSHHLRFSFYLLTGEKTVRVFDFDLRW